MIKYAVSFIKQPVNYLLCTFGFGMMDSPVAKWAKSINIFHNI